MTLQVCIKLFCLLDGGCLLSLNVSTMRPFPNTFLRALSLAVADCSRFEVFNVVATAERFKTSFFVLEGHAKIDMVFRGVSLLLG